MKNFINWIVKEINAGSSASTLLLKLSILQKIADNMSDYSFNTVIEALTKEDEDAE